MTENCTENHLIKAIEADDALTDELIAMVRHTECPDDENVREARHDLANEFIHSDAVYAALSSEPRLHILETRDRGRFAGKLIEHHTIGFDKK
jgi:hypothetical protein